MKRNLLALLLFVAMNSALALPNFDPVADATPDGGTSYSIGSGLAPNTSTNSGGGLNTWGLVNSNVISTNPQPMIVAGNLSYPDLPVSSTGNSISNAPPLVGTGASARLDLTSIAASITYYSFILKVTDLTAVPGSAVNNPIAAFSDTLGGQATTVQRMGGRLVMTNSGGGYVLGVGKGTTTADYRYDSTVRAVGDEVFVVVSYERAGGATNINLWVNPPSSSFGSNAPPAPVASVPPGANANDLNANGVRAFVISCQQAAIPSYIIDEVRVATNWGFVTGGSPIFSNSITAHPASRTVEVGDRVAFVVGNSGTAPTYQWRFNGGNISDATNSTYAIVSADATNAGSYTVVVSNVLNSLTSAPAVLTVSQTALQLYETNLVAIRVGDGAQPLATTGNSVFLDQLTTNGTYVNTIYIPDTGTSALIESGPDLAGSVLTGAALTRSADKRLMTLAGYNCERTNATALHNTTAASVPRGIVTIDSASQITMVVSDNSAYDGTHMRGAVTDGTNNFWGAGGAGGTYYFGSNAPAAFVQTLWGNTRSVGIFNGNLYGLASASGANGLMKFNGLPVTDQGTPQNILSGFSSTTTTDFSVDPTDQLIYVTTSATVQRWQYDGSLAFTNAYAITLPGPARYLTVDYSGVTPVIFVTTGDGQLCRINDTGAGSTPVVIAQSGPNQLYKGIRFGPIASATAPPTLSFTQQGSNLILTWVGAFPLLSATNVTGPYAPVSGATSPYTNNTASAMQQYFGLGTP